MKRLWWFLFVACLLFVDYRVVPGQNVNQKARLFDSYGGIGYEDASARLDNFAIHLQDQPYMYGYVIGYGPEGEGSGTGHHVIRVTKDYLVSARGIDPERVQTISGGRYKNPAEVFSELWLVPQGTLAPKPKRYKSKLETFNGKLTEYEAWDGYADSDGPSFGNVSLAAFADILRQQPKSVAYIVAFNVRGATTGTWRRVAKRDATNLQGYGIESDRTKIIYGGSVKNKDEYVHEAFVQLWVLPGDAPPPVKEASPERAPTKAVKIGTYNDFLLKYPEDERWIFEGFADVLRANEQLSVCLIVSPRNAGREEQATGPDEPPDIDTLKLVEQWKSELTQKLGIKESRIFVLHDAAGNSGTIDVWIVPPGAALPDPYAPSMDETIQN